MNINFILVTTILGTYAGKKRFELLDLVILFLFLGKYGVTNKLNSLYNSKLRVRCVLKLGEIWCFIFNNKTILRFVNLVTMYNKLK